MNYYYYYKEYWKKLTEKKTKGVDQRKSDWKQFWQIYEKNCEEDGRTV